MAASAFASWIEPLTVETAGDDVVVIARTAFALDRVQSEWGRQIQLHFGRVIWRVGPAPPSQEKRA